MAFLPDSVDPAVRQELLELRRLLQGTGHKLFKKKPLLNEIPKQGFVLADVSGSFFIYTKINNQRLRVELTPDP